MTHSSKQTKLGEIIRGRVCPDPAFLQTLRRHGGWMSAQQVAEKHGQKSWHRVAHALQRMCEQGLLETDVVEVKGAARVREHTRLYRARPAEGEVRRVETLLPGWLAPQAVAAVGHARRIDGVAGVRRWDDGPEDVGHKPMPTPKDE